LELAPGVRLGYIIAYGNLQIATEGL